MSILDHVEFVVRDAEVSRRFYEQALAPLGFSRIISVGSDRTRSGGTRHGFGKEGYPRLWIHDNELPGTGTHIAFAVEDRSLVDAFHQAALNAGGSDNGEPGVRARYHEHYYAAYVLDPDGINVEVVCQRPV
ncbi:Glyoxalase/Bleomycin resistance protein [Azotobacter vinelandii CA]|uniref:Glyoxalase/Bleomycin resistance protein n=2 Tax=Azotobacter vinelandii TaxID=354 RepID=C1DP48_AZOVD|nr:VOC family protein [Azotobacter vinelandii]ACO79401.1 Glyoxalase/Bleomycin resistance protein [Azotobacter vinelandii DJ]AGK16393.1 Glyoxalase/Bleomycin resistance protein [Azotobacter vinelandii CA]AGK21194.1 Glyoxalase/Bleomycin resistance protein [Azotobacter vinelandii CA6]SFY22157.1 Catechol 2,3-dioxygenase [Azotobacter vinelandii]GLK59486.1 glyoxalase [Azotobacter vinelandii]